MLRLICLFFALHGLVYANNDRSRQLKGKRGKSSSSSSSTSDMEMIRVNAAGRVAVPVTRNRASPPSPSSSGKKGKSSSSSTDSSDIFMAADRASSPVSMPTTDRANANNRVVGRSRRRGNRGKGKGGKKGKSSSSSSSSSDMLMTAMPSVASTLAREGTAAPAASPRVVVTGGSPTTPGRRGVSFFSFRSARSYRRRGGD